MLTVGFQMQRSYSILEWCLDTWRWDYNNAPSDGSAREGKADIRAAGCCGAEAGAGAPTYAALPIAT